MCMPDLHSFNPREDFLVSAFQDDPRLVEMFRQAEQQRRWWQRLQIPPLFGMLFALGVSSLLWWGFIEAVIHAYRWFQ